MNREILSKKPTWYVLVENEFMEDRKVRKRELSYELSFTKQEVLR